MNPLVPFNVHLFTFSSHSLSGPSTWEIRSDVATLSCYLSSTDRDLSPCQHPAASRKLSHFLRRGLLTCPSINAQWHHWVFVCLSVITGGGVETESSCVRLKRSIQSADTRLTGSRRQRVSELNLFNISATHTMERNFT